MSQTKLEIDFGQMKKLSEELEKTAEAVKREADTDGLNILSLTKAAWIGENADIFAGKEVKAFERIGEISMDLSRLSAEIYDKAKQIYEMEQKNILLTGAIGHVFI